MEQFNPSPQISTQPATPPAAPVKKKHFPFLAIIISVVITALILAGAGYFYSAWQVSLSEGNLGQEIDSLKSQGANLQLALITCEEEKGELEEQITAAEEVAQAAYQGWKTYTESQLDLSWKYPADWEVEEMVVRAGDNPMLDKNFYCTDFYSTQESTLRICYRQKDDLSTTTWPAIEFGGAHGVAVNINLIVAGREITEKTILLDDGNGLMRGIIYAQNIKDDDTGYGARVAVGDYYLTALALSVQGNETISPEVQLEMDNILASLELP